MDNLKTERAPWCESRSPQSPSRYGAAKKPAARSTAARQPIQAQARKWLRVANEADLPSPEDTVAYSAVDTFDLDGPSDEVFFDRYSDKKDKWFAWQDRIVEFGHFPTRQAAQDALDASYEARRRARIEFYDQTYKLVETARLDRGK
jgi:hypothetical protein